MLDSQLLSDLTLIVSSWFLLSLWQVIGFAFVYRLFKDKLNDAGWALGRLTSWLVIAIVIWFGAHLNWAINTRQSVFVIFFLLTAVAVAFYQRHWLEIKQWFGKKWRLVLSQELIFFIFFFFLTIVRGFNPQIEGLEKFMDAGLMMTYLKSPTLPAPDMWLAGETINYYTFGHFLGAIATHYLGISLDLSYNLLLGFLMGLIGSQVFSLVANLMAAVSDKKREVSSSAVIKAGFVGSLLVLLGGNGQAAWYWLKNLSFEGYWYPDATRFIERTIHEFPAYSFIVSDLHAHVWDLPLVLGLLTLIFVWLQALMKNGIHANITLVELLKKKYFHWAGLIGFLLGLMMSTSAWDVLIYGLLLIILGVALLVRDIKYLMPLVFSALLVGVMAAIGAAPWFLHFTSISEGFKIANEHSPLWQLAVLWLPHIVISLLALLAARSWLMKNGSSGKRPASVMIIAMVLLSGILIVLPELVYMQDIYPNHPRANTMFKLTFQAITLMNVVIAWLIGTINFLSWQSWKKVAGKVLIAVFLITVLIYPYFGYRDFYHKLDHYRGLNGLNWLQQQHPDDYKLVLWLRKHAVGQPVILEAVGESYTTYARVSTFTGFPTVLGWRVHEWLWRGGFEIPGQRTEEVKKIYTNPNNPQAKQLLLQYRVKYIIVGDKEREAYQNLDEPGLKDLGRIMYQVGDNYILEVQL